MKTEIEKQLSDAENRVSVNDAPDVVFALSIHSTAYKKFQPSFLSDLNALALAAYEAGRISAFEDMTKMYPADDWHEDLGEVLWYRLPIEEAPRVGSPMDTEWNTPWPLSPSGFSPATFYTHFQIINIREN